MPRRKSVPEPEQPKHYRLTAEDIASITELELVQGTDRLLPKEEDINFFCRNGHGPYYALAEAIMYGDEPPNMDITLNPGYPDTEIFMSQFMNCIMAHLFNVNVDHDFRLQAVAFMISKVITITPED